MKAERSRLINIGLVLLFGLLCLAVVNLALIQGRKYRSLSQSNCIRLMPQAGARGKILDRSGNIIVDNKLSYDVLLVRSRGVELENSFQAVARVLGVKAEELEKTYRKRFVSASVPAVIAENIDTKKAIALEELKSDLPGIQIQPRPLRRYPYGKLACHVVGYLNEIDRWRLTKLEDYGYKKKDIVGFGGVEEKYDFFLRQEEGGLSVEVDHRGRFMRVVGFRPPYNGKDVQLTLDLNIQRIVEDKIEGRRASVVIMDPYTGEVIAMASSPNFNPSVFTERSPEDISRLFRDSSSPMVNRAISSAFPPGSIFKPIVAAAGLETKRITPNTSFVCEGATLIGGREFKCWSTHGRQSLVGALLHSCDIFFYKTGIILSAQAVHDYALRFGLSRPSGFELPYEAGGLIPSPLWKRLRKFRSWFEGDTANMSIGQGDVLTSPLQMCRVICAFANGGQLVTPYIVKAVGDKDISIYQRKSVSIGLKDSTIAPIREGLRETVASPEGTGNVLSGLSVPVAGKTGTAQAPPSSPHGWFIGFFPFKNPKFAICVLTEHGGSGYVSCVVTKQIIEEMASNGLI